MSHLIGKRRYATETYPISPGVGNGGATGGALAFDSVPNLAAFNASAQPNFAFASVGTINDSYRLFRSPSPALLAAADGVNVVDAAAPAGAVWVRLYERNLAAEYVDTWYVDPTLGSDANAGTAPGAAALRTLTEVALRVRAIHQDVTVNVAAGDLSAAPFNLDVETNGFSMAFFGDVTSSAADVLAAVTATVAGAAGTNAGATRGAVTATAGSFTDKQRLRLTSGTNAGATAHVTRVVTPGAGGVANVERWGQLVNPRTTSTVASVEPAPGDSYVADTLNTILSRFDARARGNGRILFQDFRPTPTSADVVRLTGDNPTGGGVMLYRCQFPAQTAVITSNATIACSQFLSVFDLLEGVLVTRKNVYCGLVDIVGTSSYVISNNSACFDGGNLLLNGGSVWDQGTGSQNDHQWVDGTGATAVEIDASSAYVNHGSGNQCWGLDNAYSNVAIIVQGNAKWTNSSKPSIPGSGVVGRDVTVGSTGKLYANLPYEETTTTSNNGGGIVAV